MSLCIVTGSGLSSAAVAGVCAAVVILLAATAAGVIYYLERKKGEYYIQLIEQHGNRVIVCARFVKVVFVCNGVCHCCSNRQGGGAKSSSSNIPKFLKNTILIFRFLCLCS